MISREGAKESNTLHKCGVIPAKAGIQCQTRVGERAGMKCWVSLFAQPSLQHFSLTFQAAPQARNMSNRRWSVSVANAEPAETDSTIVQPCKG